MLKKLFLVVLLVFGVNLGSSLLSVSAEGSWTVEDVMRFRIDTKESDTVTVDSINATIERYSPTSRLRGHGDKIKMVADMYGINAAYILGQMMAETSLAAGNVYCAGESNNPYNFGCIKTRSGMASTSGGYAKPATIEGGLGLQMGLLRETYMDEWGLVTVRSVIETYAPAYDNNDHGKYYRTVGIIMSAAGQQVGESDYKLVGGYLSSDLVETGEGSKAVKDTINQLIKR